MSTFALLQMQIGCVIFGRHPMSYSLVEVRVREQRSMPQIELTAGVEKQNIAEGSGPTTPTKGGWTGWAARRPRLQVAEDVET